MKKNYSLFALHIIFATLAVITLTYHAGHFFFDKYPWAGWSAEPANTIASIVGGKYWFIVQPVLYFMAKINGNIQAMFFRNIFRK